MSGVDRVELISDVAELVEIMVLTGVVLMSGVELVVGMSVELMMAGCETVQLVLAAISNKICTRLLICKNIIFTICRICSPWNL